MGPGPHGGEVRQCPPLPRAIWIDAGTKDEWFLDVGAEAFRQALASAGVADDIVHFEHFDGEHGGIDYRYPLSLAWLTNRLAP